MRHGHRLAVQATLLHFSQHGRITIWLSAELPEAVEVKLWRAPMFEVSKYAQNYDDFCRVRGSPLSPLPPLRPCEASWTPGAVGVAPGGIPTAEEWQNSLAAVVEKGFPASEDAPVAEPDCTLAEEKGWVFEELKGIVKGGEVAYLELLQSYVRGEKAPSSSGLQPQSLDMLRVAEQLDNIPGNEYGVAALKLVTTCQSLVLQIECCSW